MDRSRSPFLWVLAVLAVGALARLVTATSDEPSGPPAPPYLEQLARDTRSDDADAQVHLATAFVREAERSGAPHLHHRALRAARRALELDAERLDAARLELRALEDTHQHLELLAAAERLAARHPHEAFFLGARGDAALALGRYEEAEAAYLGLVDREPALVTATRRAHLRRLRGDVRGAIELLQPIVRNEGTAEPLTGSTALCELGEAYLALGDSDTALQAFSVALSRNLRSDRAHLGRGHVLRMRGSHEDAIAAYQSAQNVRPGPQTRAFLADALAATGWVAEASAHYEYALRESLGGDTRFHARLLLELGRELPRAEALARQEYARRQDVFTEGLLAHALVLNGKTEEAHASITRALRLGTHDARLSYVAGLVAEARGETAEARAHFASALQGFPPLRPAQQAQVKALLGLGLEDSSARRAAPTH